MARRIRHYALTVAVATACLAGTVSTAQAQSDVSDLSAAAAPAGDVADPQFAPWLRKLVNVKSAGTKCGKTAIAAASGRGRMTLRIDETRTASSTYSKHIDATYKIISAGVGWDVTKSRSITVSGSKEVPNGKYGTLTAYTKYSGKKFDVQDTTTQEIIQKNKRAWRPIGVCFKYKQS
ncbi:hypothetical protein [Streptomyces sp. NPDC005017]|uniref:hypothetical protein n=1 Tax=Streptomyces sp. NPDC005017 TaxID=3364706 RepID=UPI0036C494A7